MPREGFWLNAKTGAWFEVFDHSQWISNPSNAQLIGLPPEFTVGIRNLDWLEDQTKIRMFALEYGLIRVRGHGVSVTVEFTWPFEKVFPVLEKFLASTFMAGPKTILSIRNLKERKILEISGEDFSPSIAPSPKLTKIQGSQQWKSLWERAHSFEPEGNRNQYPVCF